jgi:hypothetical protein
VFMDRNGVRGCERVHEELFKCTVVLFVQCASEEDRTLNCMKYRTMNCDSFTTVMNVILAVL